MISTKSICLAFIIILFCTVALGCSYRPLVVSNYHEFPGVGPSAESGLDVVLLHGMCDHETDWFEEHVKYIGEQFHRRMEDRLPTPLIEKNGVQLFKTTLTAKNIADIAVYGIIYSEANKDYKRNKLCIVDGRKNVDCTFEKHLEKRAFLNRFARDSLLDSCVSDAFIYMGEKGVEIREGMLSALVGIHNDRTKSGRSGTPLALISESLGSKILRDTLICNAGSDETDKGLALLYNSNLFYMYANQANLLNAADHADCLKRFNESKFNYAQGGASLKLQGDFSDILRILQPENAIILGLEDAQVDTPRYWVAYSDVNDLLSYQLNPAEYDGIHLFNVLVRNTRNYGLFANPIAAHTGYKRNDSIYELMKNGCAIEYSELDDKLVVGHCAKK